MKTLTNKCSMWLRIIAIIVFMTGIFDFTAAQNQYKPLKGTTPAGGVVNLSSLPPASTVQGTANVLPRHLPTPYSAAVKKYQQQQANSTALQASEEIDKSVSGLSISKVNSIQSTQSSSLVENFQGISSSSSLYTPPDPVIAVGPDYVVEAVNLRLEIYSKSGSPVMGRTFDQIFGSYTNGITLSDPKIIFDQYSQRYVLLVLGFSAANHKGVYLIAVSQSSDPRGYWNLYSSDATLDGSTPTTYGPDYPGLGYDDKAIYVTSNQLANYTEGDTFKYAKIRIFNKSQLYSDNTVTYTDFIKMSDNYGMVYTIKPAHHFGTTSSAYLLNTEPYGASSVTLWRIDNPLTNPTLTQQAIITLASYSCTNPSILVPQESSSVTIDGFGCETQDIVWRNSYLYAAFADLHNWGSGTVEAVRYVKISTSSNSAVIDADYGADGYYYFDPNIYVDAYNDIAMVFSRSSSNEYAGVRCTYRTPSDAAARPSQTLHDGIAIYDHFSWGDYSGICLDPGSDNQLWFCGEWASGSNSFSTQIGSFKFTPVEFVNSVGGSQAGGSFKINSNLTLSSGSSTRLGVGSNNTELTLAQGGSNQDRFSYTNGVILAKHNNWDGISSSYLLNNDFTVNGTPGETETAYFVSLRPATINTSVDGTSLSNINLKFNDPWYLNSNGSQGNYAQASTPITRLSSPMTGAYNQNRGGGVFLNQPYGGSTPYYSVGFPSGQSVSVGGTSHTLYFYNWSATDANIQNSASAQTGVEFTNSNASVTANLKGTQLSSDPSAFSNNSQRKLVETRDGWLHQVYTSMGHVWYEAKSPNGSWQLMNNGQPLDNGAGKCPSIDWHYNTSDPNNANYNAVVIAWQQQSGSLYTIEYDVFKYTNGSYVLQGKAVGGPLYTEPSGGDHYSSVDANPNIAWGEGDAGPFVLTFERKSTAGGMQPGIYCIYGFMYEGGVDHVPTPCSPIRVSSSSSTINAAISLNKLSADRAIFDIVYQLDNAPGSNIYDAELSCYFNGSNWVISGPYTYTLSYMTGYLNYQPSLVQMPDNNIQVCWIRDLYGSGSNTPYYVNTVYWSSSSPSVYTYSGNMVNSVSLNLRDGATSTYYAYAQHTNNSTWQNFAREGSNTIALNTTGRYIQLSNGSSSADMYASAYYPVSLPYYFQTSNSLGGLSKKTSTDEPTYGRGVVLGTDGIKFSYSMKSLTVGKDNIKFIEIPEIKDTTNHKRGVQYLTLDSLNTFLVSEPFTIQEGTSINFSEGWGFSKAAGGIDSAAAQQLEKNINVGCKIELIADGTNKPVGTVKQIQLTSENENASNLKSSNLSITSGRTETVRLKITLTTNVKGVKGMLVNEYNTVSKNTLSKLSVKELKLKTEQAITTYDLNQNYPNPFNPTTVISYQLPVSGYVTLKVYDVLGRLVKTLVDGNKSEGRYDVQFNGSNLASGVYIYQLKVNGASGHNFSSTKKLLLLK